MAICFLRPGINTGAFQDTGIIVHAITVWVLICVMGLVIITDSMGKTISNSFVMTILLTGIADKLLTGRIQEASENAIAGFLIAGMALTASVITEKIIHRKALGGGDIKILFALGFYLGFNRSLTMLCMSCILGLITAFLSKTVKQEDTFPFGPAISIAAIIAAF